MIRPIAIHLPQFHPFPENDEWWGKGFTEWTNVTRAKPIFKNHYQPQLPADLGFYDLRLEASRIAQAEMARAYGIYGFCYYHYWFNGKRLMHEPLDAMLQSGKPDFPFMYCWANENWSRRWDGDEHKLLIKQEYSQEDDIAHISYLCTKVFSDRRYIRIDGKPFFVVYRPGKFPDIKDTLKTWRHQAQLLGFPGLYIGYMQGFQLKEDPQTMGFDTAVDFQPDFYTTLPGLQGNAVEQLLDKTGIRKSLYSRHRIFDYGQYVKAVKKLPRPGYKQFPCITPMWDNTARRKDGAFILNNSTPALYQDWLQHIKNTFQPYSTEENFVFINAWNEWAEGNHLEPCTKWGRAYLEATKAVTDND